MKMLLIMTLFLLSQVKAAPVLNLNMAAEGTLMTIWPDHEDPDHFYFAPNFMKIAQDHLGKPKFHVTPYRTGQCGIVGQRLGRCRSQAMVTSLLVAGYEDGELKKAQDGILKVRPRARFSSIPFLSSEVDFGPILNDFVSSHECSPQGGQASDEVPCVITLNLRGMRNLFPYLAAGKELPFKFLYQIAGVTEGANKSYDRAVLDYGLTVAFGGEELLNHEELMAPFPWEN